MDNEDEYKNLLKMTPSIFDELLNLIEYDIKYKGAIIIVII